jgi:transcriptional/translational regulatory protein YebC/TACO1
VAGHNKWSQIKRKKATIDGARSKLFSKHTTAITIASRKCKGNLSSPALATAIDRAKKNMIPKENIERAILKGINTSNDSYKEVIFEAFGPGGVSLLIIAITNNNNRTSNEIKHLLRTFDIELEAPGSASWAFTKNDDGYTPLHSIALTPEEILKLDTLCEEIENHNDVQHLFTANIVKKII